jgi:CRISPR-associated protein Cmr4
MIKRAFLLHALSPLHAGIGASADVIDLPIARMKATGIPVVPGSSIKGVLRDVRKSGTDKDKWLATFGPEMGEAGEHAGAVIIGDARLLALPVRSFKGTFAWVTSPLLLRLAARDLEIDLSVPEFMDRERAIRGAIITGNSKIIHNSNDGSKIYLQDIDLDVLVDEGEADIWADKLAPVVSKQEPDMFCCRFAIVDDETMTFLWETATQIDVRIRIDPKTGTVTKGALWQEESLPSETLLIGLMAADRSRRNGLTDNWGLPDDIMNTALPKEEPLQFGGKASVGRGRCRMVPLARGGQNGS